MNTEQGAAEAALGRETTTMIWFLITVHALTAALASVPLAAPSYKFVVIVSDALLICVGLVASCFLISADGNVNFVSPVVLGWASILLWILAYPGYLISVVICVYSTAKQFLAAEQSKLNRLITSRRIAIGLIIANLPWSVLVFNEMTR